MAGAVGHRLRRWGGSVQTPPAAASHGGCRGLLDRRVDRSVITLIIHFDINGGKFMFCTGCGTQSADSSVLCGGCDIAQRSRSDRPSTAASTFHVGQAMQDSAVPDAIRGWCWGAFFMPWIWGIGNRTWIGLLALIPYVNIVMSIWLGMKGREMAWKNDVWESAEHFNRVQRRWSQCGFVVTVIVVIVIFSAYPGR
jgi:hypothetical protein